MKFEDSYKQIFSDLKKKIYKPIYFLMGDEPYFIDKITNYIHSNVLSEEERDFNQITLYGKDTTIEAIITASRKFPMMSNYQVIIVKEAQHIKNIEDLILYVNNPLKSTILVINYKYKSLDKRKKLYKSISNDIGYILKTEKLYDNKIPFWIEKYIEHKSYSIEPKAAQMLTEFLGNDLSKIVNELEKLIITLPKDDKKITPIHIEKNIGISKDYNNFELNNALSKKDVIKANRIINYFNSDPVKHPLLLTIGTLFYHFNKILTYHFIKDKSNINMIAATLKMNKYFVKDIEFAARNYPPSKVVYIIEQLREYDLKSKGKNNATTTDKGLLKELIYKILH